MEGLGAVGFTQDKVKCSQICFVPGCGPRMLLVLWEAELLGLSSGSVGRHNVVPMPVYLLPAAQQEAQRAQFLVEKAKQEQKQKIVQAEGEATAAKMISCFRRFCGMWLVSLTVLRICHIGLMLSRL